MQARVGLEESRVDGPGSSLGLRKQPHTGRLLPLLPLDL